MKILAYLFLLAAAAGIAGCEGASVTKTEKPSNVAVGRAAVIEMTPAEAAPAIAEAYAQFVDVRTPAEYDGGHADRAINIPLDTLAGNLDRLERHEPVYIICESGRRSKQAAEILSEAGFVRPISIIGGTPEWKAAGLPMAPRSAKQ